MTRTNTPWLIIWVLILSHCAYQPQPISSKHGILTWVTPDGDMHKQRIHWLHYDDHDTFSVVNGPITLASITLSKHGLTYQDPSQSKQMPPFPKPFDALDDFPIDELITHLHHHDTWSTQRHNWQLLTHTHGLEATANQHHLTIQWR